MPTGLPPRPQTRPLAGCAIGSRMPFRAGLGTRTVVGGLDRIERQPPITAPSPPCSSTTAATSNQVCSIQNRCSFADLCTAQLDLVPVAPFTALERRPHRRIGDVDGCGPNRGEKRTLAISLCSGMIGSLAGHGGRSPQNSEDRSPTEPGKLPELGTGGPRGPGPHVRHAAEPRSHRRTDGGCRNSCRPPENSVAIARRIRPQSRRRKRSAVRSSPSCRR